MKNILSILLVSVILIGCSENNKLENSTEKELSNEERNRDINGIDTTIRVLHDLESEDQEFTLQDFQFLYKGKPFNGTLYQEYENGQLEYEGTFKDGYSHGFWKSYFEDGNLKSEVFCSNGVELSSRQWDENGDLISPNY